MKKLFNIILSAFMAMSIVVLPNSTYAMTKDQEIQPYAVVRTVEVNEYGHQTYTLGSEKMYVTVRLQGSYLLTNGNSISNVSLVPTVSYANSIENPRLTAKYGKMEKVINSNSIDVTITVLIYENGIYEGIQEYEFTV